MTFQTLHRKISHHIHLHGKLKITCILNELPNSTLARSKELEAEERANNNIRRLVANDAHQPQSPGIFSDDSEETAAAQALDEESRIGFRSDGVVHGYDLDADIDDDHVAIGPIGYHDDFTDNDSDVFDDGDGDGTADATETLSLHRHIESK